VVVNQIVAQARHASRRSPLMRTGSWAIVGVVLPLLMASCATFDEPYSVSIKNDLNQTVTLAVCDSQDCSKYVNPRMLRPGQTGTLNVQVNAGYNPAVILGAGNVRIGCLPFRLSERPPADVMASVSQAVPCGRSGGIDAAHNKDWPDPKV
jgi:hypothetical protein